MTEELLREALNKAQENGKIGLFIWASESAKDYLKFYLKENENYKKVLDLISKGDELTIYANYDGVLEPGMIAVSAKKMFLSEKTFKRVFKACEKDDYLGPITFVPLN